MTELGKQEHITKEQFDCWQHGAVDCSQEKAFLEHIGTCTFCAEQFGTWMEQGLMEPPAYLKVEITERTGQLDVQTVVKMKQTSKKVELVIYSLKVGLAVAASIFLLTVTTGVQKMNVEISQKQPDRVENVQKEESITDRLNRGSNFITDALNGMSRDLFQIERESSKEHK